MNCTRCHNSVRENESFCGNCGTVLSSPEPVLDDALAGQVLDSKYELIRRLGQGGMGAVYRARRKHIGDEVAIKVLLDKFVAGSEATERFRREARAAAMLRHPNVVTIHDFSDGAGASSPAYIVMELVEGRSLRDVLDQEGRIAAERMVTMMRGVCSGVSAAHRKGVVHRDLKPDNIIIIPPERAGDFESVKVIDFGIAKLREADASAGLTQTGVLIGTPYYMSPEQCLGDPLDARSDVYSIGAILYEMLSGAPPFTGTTPTAVLARHLTDTATPLDQLGIPARLASVPGRALAKDPKERYQTVDDLFNDLGNAVMSLSSSAIGPAETVRTGASAATIGTVAGRQTGGMGETTIVGTASSPSMVATQVLVDDKLAAQAETRAELSRRLRWARNLGLIGGVLVFGFSIGIGFLIRWLGWANLGSAYDEVALVLIIVALRDAIFGVFVGIILSAIRIRGRNKIGRSHWGSSLLTYGSTGAAIAMLPFVLLRTSMFLLPVGIAILGLFAGLIICGVKLLIQQFAKK